MVVDTTHVDQALAEVAEAEQHLDEARQVYYRAVAAAVEHDGATAVARALGLSRARIYQLLDQLDEQ